MHPCQTPSEYHEMNPQVCWFTEDICREYSRIARRLSQLQPKRHRRRILFLSTPIPRKVVHRALPKSNGLQFCPKKIEIIRDPPVHTRTEQLAYPPSRKLVPVLEGFKNTLGRRRFQVLSLTLKKSLFSMYSRLANCQPPKEKCRPRKWSKREWAMHRRALNRLAHPKKVFRPPKQVHMWKDISIMDRFRYLCKPKSRYEASPYVWILTKGVRRYKATAKIKELSKPKQLDPQFVPNQFPLKVNPRAKLYIATARIKALATRAQKSAGVRDLKENPFGVMPNAKKAKASARVIELAEPKEFTDTHTRANPFAISPAALKAKATPRTIELAQPKTYGPPKK